MLRRKDELFVTFKLTYAFGAILFSGKEVCAVADQAVFKRYELKYMLTVPQKERLLQIMEPYMRPDKYGCTTICNLYFDTDDYLLIRRSIEKPAYKEKLRLRSYGRATPDSKTFVEMKRKYSGVVYKRRVSLPEEVAMQWLTGDRQDPGKKQINRELDYFLDFYKTLKPRVFISYRRQAYYAKDDSGFRMTFDDTVLSRQTDLSLQSEAYGQPILPEDKVLMEVKCAGGIPLWLTEFLSREKIYKTSFSKYGTVYQTIIYPQLKETAHHA